ncbi:uncharacterized protein LOC129962282 [Argiope bruennichi]|uniref:uncharacterized protein LOC129962282 n=1 Tax=Argiope bruennichi TaxID=94029 RepID=UPI0024957E3E|nr:uncharacterized protein LOC129962282 [Argiope bruennichi]
MKSLKNSVSEIMARAQRTAYSIAEEDVRGSRRYPETNEEDESISRNDELAFMTSASMVHSHLQNLVNEIKRTKPEENSEKYLTEEFLQLIADRIAQEGFMRSNFQNLLTAESLFRLGQVYYYQKNRNSGNSNIRDVKLNIGVQVGGQEITLPKSKTEKREDTSH